MSVTDERLAAMIAWWPIDSDENAVLRELQSARQRIACLTEALRVLYDDNMEYFQINNLAGCENNLPMRIARAALSGSANG